MAAPILRHCYNNGKFLDLFWIEEVFLVYGSSNFILGFSGAKYPFIQFGFTTHNCTCVLSRKAEPGYGGSPSTNIPRTESNLGLPVFKL